MASKVPVTNPTNTTFAKKLANTEESKATSLLDLEAVNFNLKNLLKNYKGIGKEEVRVLNRYYFHYGSDYSMENLAWSNDQLLNTCEEPLRNKIVERCVGVDTMEMRDPLVLKMVLDVIVDVDDSVLRAIAQSLHTT